jgi:hypothetical protein
MNGTSQADSMTMVATNRENLTNLSDLLELYGLELRNFLGGSRLGFASNKQSPEAARHTQGLQDIT